MDLKIASAHATARPSERPIDADSRPAPERRREAVLARPRRPHAARGAWRPRADGHLAVAHAARGERPRRLDQPGGDRPHRRAARRLARRGVRRRQLLRPVLDGSSARPHQVHVCVDLGLPRERRRCPSTSCPPAPTPSPCLGVCERAPAALVIDAGDVAAGASSPASVTPVQIAAWAAGASPSTADETPASRRRAAGRRPVAACCCAAPAASTRSRSTPTSPTAGSPRSPRLASSAREGVIAQVDESGLTGRGGAAFPTAVASGRPCARRRPHRTTSCATPTSPSRARSRTAR